MTKKKIGFTGDTELFEEMKTFYADCDVLVMNVMRPVDNDWKGHLTTEDAADLLNAVEPALGICHHFGSLFIYNSVTEQEAWLQEHTDIDFVMAEDDMTIDISRPKQGLEQFFE